MAVVGLIMGNHDVRYAMSDHAKEAVISLWTVIDEILNSVLFLLVGLEAIVVWHEKRIMLIALAAIPIVLTARLLSVGIPLSSLTDSMRPNEDRCRSSFGAAYAAASRSLSRYRTPPVPIRCCSSP